jgi:phospholipase C
VVGRGGETESRPNLRPHGFAKMRAAARGMHKIKHVVFIIKENRSFDNYFGTFPGAEGATSGRISTGQTIPLGHTPDRTPRDISHSFQSAVTAIDGGAMDRFDLIPGGGTKTGIISRIRS